jgi:hypothetical protein
MNDTTTTNQNKLTKQEKIELLKKVIGEYRCFLCFRAVFPEKEPKEKTVLTLCLNCYDRHQILKSLEEQN